MNYRSSMSISSFGLRFSPVKWRFPYKVNEGFHNENKGWSPRILWDKLYILFNTCAWKDGKMPRKANFKKFSLNCKTPHLCYNTLRSNFLTSELMRQIRWKVQTEFMGRTHETSFNLNTRPRLGGCYKNAVTPLSVYEAFELKKAKNDHNPTWWVQRKA